MRDMDKNHYGYNGCDFLCANNECPNCDTKITLVAMCPIIEIDEAIAVFSKLLAENSSSVKCAGIVGVLEKRKSEGRKYAIAPVQIADELRIVGYRNQFFCEKCLVVWDKDIPELDKQKIAESLKSFRCERCGGPVKSMMDGLVKGVPCPKCDKALKVVPWLVQGYCANIDEKQS